MGFHLGVYPGHKHLRSFSWNTSLLVSVGLGLAADFVFWSRPNKVLLRVQALLTQDKCRRDGPLGSWALVCRLYLLPLGYEGKAVNRVLAARLKVDNRSTRLINLSSVIWKQILRDTNIHSAHISTAMGCHCWNICLQISDHVHVIATFSAALESS